MILGFQAWELNENLNRVSLDPITVQTCPESVQAEDCIASNDTVIGHAVQTGVDPLTAAFLALEFDAQFLRTKRHQSILAARLFVQSIAILAGLTLLLLGGAFIFARIEATYPQTANIRVGDGKTRFKASWEVGFSGLFFASLGTLIICFTIGVAAFSRIKVIDGPSYVSQRIEPTSPERSTKDISNEVQARIDQIK